MVVEDSNKVQLWSDAARPGGGRGSAWAGGGGR